MISFKKFLDTLEKKFVSLSLTKETEDKLREYAIKNGFNLGVNYDGSKIDPKDFHFHLTIFYTKNEFGTENREIPLKEFNIIPRKLDLFGKSKDIPVLRISLTKLLKDIRTEFEIQGYEDNWPNYKPHISLSYDKKQYNLENIDLPDFPIVVNKLSIQKQS